MSKKLMRTVSSSRSSRLLSATLPVLAVVTAGFVFAHEAKAADGTWNVDANGDWSLSGNWLGGTVADGVGATADFSTLNITGTRVVTLDGAGTTGSRTVGVLNLGDTDGTHAYTIARVNSNALAFDNTGSTPAQINVNTPLAANGGTYLLSTAVVLNDSLNTALNSNRELQISGVVSGTGNITHAGNGNGVFYLNNAGNTFVGNVSNTSTTSRVQVNGDGSLGALTNNISLAENTELRFSISNSTYNALRTISVAANATPATAARIGTDDSNGHRHIGSRIVGTGAVRFNTGGTIVLSGDNTYSGGTFITSANRLTVSSDKNLGTGALALDSYNGTLSVIGTQLNSFGSRVVTFGSGNTGGYAFDIQDVANTFNFDRNMGLAGFNSGNAIPFAKTGRGEVKITTAQTTTNITGSSYGANGGTLTFDYATGAAITGAGINRGNRITFGGGTLNLLANGGATTTTQYLGNFRMNAGGSTLLIDNKNGTAATDIHFGDLSTVAPLNGSALNIRTVNAGSGGISLNSILVNDSTGIAGGARLVLNGSDWLTSAATSSTGVAYDVTANTFAGALVDGQHVIVTSPSASLTNLTQSQGYFVVQANGSNYKLANTPGGAVVDFAGVNGTATVVAEGAITAYTGYTNVPAAGTPSGVDTNNSRIDASSGVAGATVLGGNWTTNTLKVEGGNSLNLGASTLSLAAGGLLVTDSDGYTISGGTLKSTLAGTNSDLLIHHNGAGTLEIGSVITNGNGASTLTKTGTGTLLLTNTNTYTGASFITGGVVSISSATNLGTGTLTVAGGTLRVTADISTNKAITLGGSGGTFDIADGRSLTLTNTGTNGFNGGALIVNNVDPLGTGKLILSGSDNKFTGGVWIDRGTIQLTAGSNSNGGLSQAGVNALTFGSGNIATLQINGSRNITVAGLSSTNTAAVVENGANSTAATFTVYNGANNTFAGVIRNGAGTGTLSFIKGGAGDLTLSNTSTYTGATTVQAGRLILNGSLSNTSVVNVIGTGTLAGNGAIINAVNITGTSATIAPGNSVGSLSTGTLTIDSASYAAEINTTAVTSDRIVVSGGLNILNSAMLSLTDLGSNALVPAAAKFVLITYTGAWNDGLFDGYADDSTFSFGSNIYTIDYNDSFEGVNAVTLTAVPEPASIGMLLLGATAILTRRRRV